MVWIAVICIKSDATSEAPHVEVIGVYLTQISAVMAVWQHIVNQGDFLLKNEVSEEEFDYFLEWLQCFEKPLSELHHKVKLLSSSSWLYEEDRDFTITEHDVE
jgi:hypothetical protein